MRPCARHRAEPPAAAGLPEIAEGVPDWPQVQVMAAAAKLQPPPSRQPKKQPPPVGTVSPGQMVEPQAPGSHGELLQLSRLAQGLPLLPAGPPPPPNIVKAAQAQLSDRLLSHQVTAAQLSPTPLSPLAAAPLCRRQGIVLCHATCMLSEAR